MLVLTLQLGQRMSTKSFCHLSLAQFHSLLSELGNMLFTFYTFISRQRINYEHDQLIINGESHYFLEGKHLESCTDKENLTLSPPTGHESCHDLEGSDNN